MPTETWMKIMRMELLLRSHVRKKCGTIEKENHNADADTPCGTTTSSDSISVATKSKDYQTTHSVVVICFRGETQIGKLLMYVSIAALHTVAPQ